MKELILLTGAGGFVGQALVRCAEPLDELKLVILSREAVASQIDAAVQAHPQSRISLLNLAWPSIPSSAAAADIAEQAEAVWSTYEVWLTNITEAALSHDLRFFQVGSGIDRYANNDPQVLSGAYQRYARRKDEAWKLIKTTLPGQVWRLRLHFLFGVGEAAHRLVPSAIAAALRGNSLQAGSLDRQRSWVDIDDVAAGLIRAIGYDEPADWDICGRHLISIGELLEIVADSVGLPLQLEASPAEPADAGLAAVEPEAVAPFLDSELGSKEYLQQRLARYARILQC